MKKNKLRNLFRGVFMFFVVGIACVVSRVLAVFIFKGMGTSNDLIQYLVSVSIFFFFLWLLFQLKPEDNEDYVTSIFDTLRNVSQGNFNVLIEQNKGSRFDELAVRINEMAKELGSMERLRQDFISNISHEFQSPLTSIIGYATLLRKNGATSQQIEYATIIEEESKRLSKLADNLLLLSALETDAAPMEKTVYRLDRQLENVILLLEPQWSAKNIEPETDLHKIEVLGNEDLLKQVWINLLVNAIKFTPESGEIQVSVKSGEGSIECHIADSGIGIAPTDQMRIFERFYKVDKARDRSIGGNGLGLSLVKKIVELHGGNITVESVLGRRTIFIVTLPSK
ncbi:two-component sensor histidine kinase [Clostridia bacterium]|nr:two-component sensor histidine kinase [Clostridia bacterium]